MNEMDFSRDFELQKKLKILRSKIFAWLIGKIEKNIEEIGGSVEWYFSIEKKYAYIISRKNKIKLIKKNFSTVWNIWRDVSTGRR